MAELQWVNHASYVVQHDHIRLLTDPWLFGSAFNHGWDLLSETRFAPNDWRGITHLWFSHEHPDHFSPPVLSRIPREVAQGITVLFQETRDRKVLAFCERLGFRVQELGHHRWHELAPGCRVMCGKVPFYDSWLLMDAGGLRLLNTNDCVVDGDGVATDIAKHTGNVDLLLTQFSYANWIGNPEDAALRRAAAREKLGRVGIQAAAFRPRFVIPFASFVYFSHEENCYLNDAINTVDDARRYLEEETPAAPVVLYPGDRWVVGAPHDNGPALDAYAEDYAAIPRALRGTETVPMEELTRLSIAYVARITSRNSRLLMRLMRLPPLGYFRTVTFTLSDLGIVVSFDFEGGLRAADAAAVPDVTLSSESLAFVLAHDWGFDTLLVNGRFRASPSAVQRMTKLLFLGPLNNTGRSLRLGQILDRAFMARAVRRVMRAKPR